MLAAGDARSCGKASRGAGGAPVAIIVAVTSNPAAYMASPILARANVMNERMTPPLMAPARAMRADDSPS
jgi:hypothetical protein